MTHRQTHHFVMRHMNEIDSMARVLAHYFPTPAEAITGIYELLVNAIEHGNLGIGYAAKTDLIYRGAWQDEVARRSAAPEFADKKVDIDVTFDNNECQMIICDQGQGFPWQTFEAQTSQDWRPNGRGLWIARHSPFDLNFNPAGNQVTCTARNA